MRYTVVASVSIICMTVLGAYAIHMGHNGAVLATVGTLVGTVLGYVFGARNGSNT